MRCSGLRSLDVEIQRCRDTEMQRWMDTEIQDTATAVGSMCRGCNAPCNSTVRMESAGCIC